MKAIASDHIIVDMTLAIDPGVEGHLVELPPGDLEIRLQHVGPPPHQPVDFAFVGYRGLDPGAAIEGLVPTRSRTYTVQLSGGAYMYSFRNQAPVSPDAGLATLTNFRQWIAVRMALRPRGG